MTTQQTTNGSPDLEIPGFLKRKQQMANTDTPAVPAENQGNQPAPKTPTEEQVHGTPAEPAKDPKTDNVKEPAVTKQAEPANVPADKPPTTESKPAAKKADAAPKADAKPSAKVVQHPASKAKTDQIAAEQAAADKRKAKAAAPAPAKAPEKGAKPAAGKVTQAKPAAPAPKGKAASQAKPDAKGKAPEKGKAAAPAKAPAEKDAFGFKKGSLKAKAVEMYSRKEGATLLEVKLALDSAQLNVLKELESQGFKVDKQKEPGKGKRPITRYYLRPKGWTPPKEKAKAKGKK